MVRSVIVMKGGTVLRLGAGSNARGECGETEGLARRLVELGCRVTLFGRVEGELPGANVVQACLDDLDEWATCALHNERLAESMRRLEAYAPFDALFQTGGYAPTMSYVDNPRAVTVQAAAIRYQAPMLEALHHFDLPRIVVNNDPRTYPRDQEMSLGKPNVRPVALLDQYPDGEEHPQVVGGKKYMRISAYGRSESWAWHPPRDPVQKTCDVVVMGHAHVATGIGKYVKNDSLLEQWRTVLGGCECPVYGEGWPETGIPGLEDVKPLPQPAAFAAVAAARCCPVVSHTPYFMTGKPYVLVANHCVPLLVGPVGTSVPYDHNGSLRPLDDKWRIREPGDMRRLASALRCDKRRSALLEEWREAVKPDWSRLDTLLEDLPRWREESETAWWLDRYGGYARVR